MSKVDKIEDDIRPEYLDWTGAVRGKFAGRRPAHRVTVTIEISRLADGRWRALAAEFPDAVGYGDDPDKALDQGEDRIAALFQAGIERGDIPPTGLNFAIDYQ